MCREGVASFLSLLSPSFFSFSIFVIGLIFSFLFYFSSFTPSSLFIFILFALLFLPSPIPPFLFYLLISSFYSLSSLLCLFSSYSFPFPFSSSVYVPTNIFMGSESEMVKTSAVFPVFYPFLCYSSFFSYFLCFVLFLFLSLCPSLLSVSLFSIFVFIFSVCLSFFCVFMSLQMRWRFFCTKL